MGEKESRLTQFEKVSTWFLKNQPRLSTSFNLKKCRKVQNVRGLDHSITARKFKTLTFLLILILILTDTKFQSFKTSKPLLLTLQQKKCRTMQRCKLLKTLLCILAFKCFFLTLYFQIANCSNSHSTQTSPSQNSFVVVFFRTVQILFSFKTIRVFIRLTALYKMY